MQSDFPAKKCNRFANYLGRSIIKISGWKIAGGVPKNSQSMVIIAAPHTTNWDLVYLLGAAYSFRLSINWLGKSNLFFPVFGAFMRFLGGIPVDRSKSNNLVTQLASQIENSDGLAIVVPPAGTRAYTDHWKSGFYRIAVEAKIPIVCGYLDFPKKEAGLGLSFMPSGDIKQDMDKIRAFYADKVGKYPENKSRIILREEEEEK